MPPARSASRSASESGERAFGQGLGQLAARAGGQRPQLDLVVAVREHRTRVLAEAPGGLVALGAVDEQDAELHLVREGEQVLDQLDRERVRPLQVVDHDAERARVGEAVDDRAHGGERLLLHGLAAELPERRIGLRLERQRKQAREERVGRFGALRESAQRRLQLEPHAGLGRVGRDAEPVAQEVPHRPVGEALGVRAGAPLEEADALAEAAARLDHEA